MGRASKILPRATQITTGGVAVSLITVNLLIESIFISASLFINIAASVSANSVDLSPIPSVGLSVGLSACVSGK